MPPVASRFLAWLLCWTRTINNAIFRIMKIRRGLSLVCLAACVVVPQASAQVRPSLGVQWSGGQPILTLTGTAGTVYSIQYAEGLSPTNLWVNRTLLQAQGASSVWSDPLAPGPIQQFYRAVSVPAPADSNLVFIQPGTFTMGSPTNEARRVSDEVQHVVTISRGFWMEKFLVTQGDYLALMSTNPSNFSGDLARPVESMTWIDATNYCWLRTQQERALERIPANYTYRLPTESEWEYAARAGTTTAIYLGSSLHSGQANFAGWDEYDSVLGTVYNPNGIYLGLTTPVGSYSTNNWGLYDMIGNVWEECQDLYGDYPTGPPVIDPKGPAMGSVHVVRGGSWDNLGEACRSATRNTAEGPDFYTGFRAVLALAQ